MTNTPEVRSAFDRGWDKLPGFEEAQEAVDTLCTLWN